MSSVLPMFIVFVWFAFFSKAAMGERLWMCTCCVLLVWWLLP